MHTERTRESEKPAGPRVLIDYDMRALDDARPLRHLCSYDGFPFLWCPVRYFEPAVNHLRLDVVHLHDVAKLYIEQVDDGRRYSSRSDDSKGVRHVKPWKARFRHCRHARQRCSAPDSRHGERI